MDILFEQRIVQNPAIAAELIWSAVSETYATNGRTQGVPFPLIFLVLPLTFHRRTARSLAGRTQPGALYKAVSEDREIVVGLQERMQSLSEKTLAGLSVGLHSGLLELDPNHERHILPGKKTEIVTHVTEDIRYSFNAAKRVGQAFAEMTIEQLAVQLNIRF